MLYDSLAVAPCGVLVPMQLTPDPGFSQQYVRYRRFVGHALRRVGVAEADVDDLAQEVFVVLLRNMRELTEPDRLQSWLHQVARRIASNHRRGALRRARRHRHGSVAEPLDPELAVARTEAAGFLAEFLEQLDEDARAVFVLSEVEGLSAPRIAERLGLNLNTTYSRIRAVRRRFGAAVERRRAAGAAWVLALPSLVSSSAGGFGGLGGLALRTSAGKTVAGLVVLVVVVLGLLTLTRGSCSADGGSAEAAPPLADRDRGVSPGPAVDEPSAGYGSAQGAVIKGRVEDLDGRGIADATVCLERDDESTPRCTTSDRDGRYALAGEPGPARVIASAHGFVAAPAFDDQPFRRIRVPPVGVLAGMDLLLRPGGREVSGVVRDVVGGPIEGATVASVLRGGVAATRARTDGDGRFTLWVDAADFVRIVARAEGYVPGHALEYHPSGDAFAIVLFPEAVIEGRVVDARSGQGVAEVVVEVRAGRHAPPQTARTDAGGRFRLAELRPGRYKPRVRHGSWLGHAVHAVALELGETVDDVVVEVHPALQIVGRVQRPDGTPCGEGRATARDVSGQEVDTHSADVDGHVRLGGLLPGEYTVAAACESDLGAHEVEFVVGLFEEDVEDEVWEVPVELHGDRALRGRVLGQGRPVPFARIEAVRDGVLEDGTMVGPTARADRSGRFAIEGLPPGLYRVYVEAEGFARDQAANVQIEDVDVDVDLEVSLGGRVRIYTVDPSGAPVGGVAVKIAATFNHAARWVDTNASGWADATDLDPGDYEMVVSRPGVGGRAGAEDPSRSLRGVPVSIVGGDGVEVTLTVPARSGRISGRALRTDGDPVADARVTVRSSWTYLDYIGEERRATVGEARTDAEGRFSVDGLEDEHFSVVVRDAFGQTASVGDVRPGEVVNLALDAPGEIRGSVEIEGEPPPAQFTVSVSPASGARYSESFLHTEGRWSIVGVPPGGARVEVTSPWGTAQATVEVELGGDAEPLVLRLAPRGRVEGQLVRASGGEPLAGAHVVVLSDHGPATGAVGITNDAGRFEVATAPSGKVVVKVIAPVGYRAQRIPGEVPAGGTLDVGTVALEAVAPKG